MTTKPEQDVRYWPTEEGLAAHSPPRTTQTATAPANAFSTATATKPAHPY